MYHSNWATMVLYIREHSDYFWSEEGYIQLHRGVSGLWDGINSQFSGFKI